VVLKSEVLVVVPALNEAASIASVVSDIQGHGFKLVVVDDGSHDNTSEVARAAGADVISLPFNAGVGGALRCGFRYAVEHGYQAIIQCDADGQHHAYHLDDLVNASNSLNADMVIGSRFLSSENMLKPSRFRLVAMWWLAKIASRAAKHEITDSTSGFRLIKQPLLGKLSKSLPAYYLGDTFETVVVSGRVGYMVREIGVAMAPRSSGESTSSNWQSVALIGKALTVTIFGLHFRISPYSSDIMK
jgi:glycosyltransferase involved in cell wall biosynthesis